MKTIHKTTIVSSCPRGGKDIYDVEFHVDDKIIEVETIEDAIKTVTTPPTYQETLTQMLADKLGCKVVTFGMHGKFSTEWKLSPQSAALATEAKRRGKMLHMGRCNTKRRLQAAYDLGCDSVDGTRFSKWPDRWLIWGLDFIRSLEKQPTLQGMV